MARALMLAIAPALALALSGCIDFVAPERQTPPVGGFVVALRVSSDSILVNATLVPGPDAEGTERAVISETLRVNGVAIAPDPRGFNLEYRAALPHAGENGMIDVTAPLIEDVPVFGPYRFTTIARDGPADTTIASGAPIILRISLPEGAPVPTPTMRVWSVNGSGGGRSFNATGRERPPATITIPPDLLPATGTYHVGLTNHYRIMQAIIPEAFRAEAWIAQHIEWTFEIVES